MRKKITMLLASLFACVGVMKAATPTEELKASTVLPSLGIPEYQFYVRGTMNELYWTSTTDDTKDIANAGKFALYAVPGLQNCYYLYSINEGKWLTYPNDNRNNRADFVQSDDNFDANAYWEITATAHSDNACYQLRPTSLDKDYDGITRVKTDRYANWYTGAASNSSIGLWQQSPSDDAGSSWSFISVDVTGQLDVLLSQRIAVANEILAAQTVYAKGEGFLTTENANTILSSPYSDTDEGTTFVNVVDGNTGTCWHSNWHDGSQYGGSHYVTVDLGESTPDLLSFSYSRRSAADNDHTTRWAVYGVPADNANITDASRDGLTLLAMISTPWGNKNEVFNSLPPFKTLGFKKFRIYSEATEQNRGYFHIGEFQLNGNTIADSNEDRVKQLAAAVATAEALKTVTQADIDALNEKISLFSLSDEDRARGQELLNLTGVGYPAENSAARIALKNAVESDAAMLDELNEAIAAFKASTDITLPENGKAYKLAFVANDDNLTNYNVIANGTDLSVSSTDEATTFYCVKYTNVDGQERYAFVSPEGNFLGYHALTTDYKTHVDNDKRLQNDFAIASMVGVTSNYIASGTEEKRFGTVSMKATNRILESQGKAGCFILKFSDSENLPFDKTDAPYYNGNYTSAIKFTEVTDYAASNDVLVAASTIQPLTKGYIQVGEGIGKYAYTYGENTGRAFEDFEALVNAATAVIADSDYSFTINMPAAGFYRIKSMNSSLHPENKGKYIQNSMSGDGLAIANTADANSIMYYNGNNILSYASGLYINKYNTSAAIGAVETEPTTWVVSENANVVGTYAMMHSTDGWYMSDWNSATETTYGNNDANAAWIFEEVVSLPVAVSAAGYATLYAPVALEVPAEGVTVYTAIIENGYLALDKVEGAIIPANTGVIIEATEGSYDFTVVDDVEATVTSDLVGSYAKSVKDADAKVYTLQKPAENEVGFYLFKGQDTEGATTYINGFRAWVEVEAGAEAPAMFSLGRGEGTTSIDNVELTNDNVVIYDLAGRRVEKMEKGIYIVNGKKVVK